MADRKPTPPPAEQLQNIPLDLIDVGAQQLRQDADDEDLIELAEDINRRGLLQPIGVSPTDNGRFQLRWGSRRLRAHHYLKRPTILARTIAADDSAIVATAGAENLHRRQLTLAEECEMVGRMHTDEKRSPNEIAAAFSKSRAWVMRRLAIPHLPKDLAEPVLTGTLAVACAESLSRLTDDFVRLPLTQHVIFARLPARDVEQLVQDTLRASTEATALAAPIANGPSLAPSQILLTCSACGRPRLPHEITLVRVCSDGCAAPATDEHPTHPPPNGGNAHE